MKPLKLREKKAMITGHSNHRYKISTRIREKLEEKSCLGKIVPRETLASFPKQNSP